MKIAICVHKVVLGGVGTSTYILCTGMRQAGHDADILSTAPGAGQDYARARRDGWPVEAICEGTPWLRRRLEITLERLTRYDVVINNHSMETQLILPALPMTMIRLSIIRSTDHPVITGALLNSSALDALVGISPQVSSLLEQSGCRCAVRMIPNAVLLRNDAPPVLSRPLRIIFVGRLEERQKNIFILPEIAKALVERGVGFQMQIVGDGPHRRDLEEKARRLGLDGCVHILGELEREQTWKMFQESHFAVLPSNFEGFGLVVAEAMAAGCVPIVSDIPVFRWILGNHAPLLTAPIKDAQAYAERLSTIAEDPRQYVLLQQRLCRRQRENFTPEATVQRYLDLIHHLRCEHDPGSFAPMPLQSLKLPWEHRLRYSRFWRFLQLCKYRGRPMNTLTL